MVLVLNCLIIGEGSVISIVIRDWMTVALLKKAIKEEKPNKIKIDADQLGLFLAIKDGAWLPSNDPAVQELKEGGVRPEIFTRIADSGREDRSSWLSLDALRDYNELPPTSKQIHVLAKVMAPVWKLAATKCPFLTIDAQNPVIRIPKAYAQGSGLYVEEDGLELFQRREVQQEWEALRASVVQSYALLWIVGPPGTGKSCAAFAFVCSLKRSGDELDEKKWSVLWIHCEKEVGMALYCILFSGADEKRTCYFEPSKLTAVLASLDDYTIIFFDGYVKDGIHQPALNACGI